MVAKTSILKELETGSNAPTVIKEEWKSALCFVWTDRF